MRVLIKKKCFIPGASALRTGQNISQREVCVFFFFSFFDQFVNICFSVRLRFVFALYSMSGKSAIIHLLIETARNATFFLLFTTVFHYE